DFGGIFYSRFENVTVTAPVVVGFTQKVVGTTQTVTIDTAGNKIVTNTPIIQSTPIVVQQQVTQRQVIRVPLAGRYQGVFVSDNDSPRPLDRIYFGYNFLSDVGRSFNPGLGNTDIQRQTMGFEKTILDGDASVGMRLPFVQEYGPGFGSRDVGDLTLALKYAWFNNRQTGDIISSGFWVTAPTGSGSAILADGTNAPHSWLFQPWTGFVMSFDRAYVLGISNLVVPSLGRDPTVWGNSLALGYWLYRSPADRLVTGVVPVVEAHVRTPLNQRDPNGVIFLQDQLNLTTGVHFRTSRGVISPAICVPLIGPRPWALEAMCYANWLF
ncbi:MAG TPA: hypothetical protein VKE74_25305, partial [Gemmataceae bacterium]|nr:hypothetical protein [Gemmataceae bacterium]